VCHTPPIPLNTPSTILEATRLGSSRSEIRAGLPCSTLVMSLNWLGRGHGPGGPEYLSINQIVRRSFRSPSAPRTLCLYRPTPAASRRGLQNI
ncbi:hypothetical protein L9F63_011304, partial [Diploptera punctata]